MASRSEQRVVPCYHPVGRCRPNLPSHLRQVLLSSSVRLAASSSHRFYLLRYLHDQPPSRRFYLFRPMAPAGTASRYHLDNLYAGGSLKLHEKGRTRESHGNGGLIQFHCVASLSRDFFFMGDATRVVSSSMSFVIPRRFRFEVVFFCDSPSGRWHGVAIH